MKGGSCVCMVLLCKKIMADVDYSNRKRRGAFECVGVAPIGSSKGTLLHHAKNVGKLL